MLLRAIILCFIFTLSFQGYSQKILIAKALRSLQANELDLAKGYIDSAAIHKDTKILANTWYYRGFIYKTLYNEREKSDKKSAARKESINSFKHFFEIDTLGELYETAFKSTKYLANTLYNDAVTSLNTTSYELAIENFEEYKTTMRVIEPHYDFQSIEISFNLVLGQVYSQIHDQDKEKNKKFHEKIETTYKYVLELDSVNYSGNYNLGILYYNEAVSIIKNLDIDVDLITLELIQDGVIQLFNTALPYMQRAYRINPRKKEVLNGLSGIYFSINKMDKSLEIQEELEELKKAEKQQNQEKPEGE